MKQFQFSNTPNISTRLKSAINARNKSFNQKPIYANILSPISPIRKNSNNKNYKNINNFKGFIKIFSFSGTKLRKNIYICI